MILNSEEILHEFIKITKENILSAEVFLQLCETKLNHKISSESWSILECIEHLNLYGDFYNNEISKRIKASSTSSSVEFTSGFLGNYFVKSMLPKEKLSKMKTVKTMNPIGSNLDKKVLDKFILQQNNLLALLYQSSKINLGKVKTSISFSRFIKLKIGDTLRFVVYHNLRHIKQAENILL